MRFFKRNQPTVVDEQQGKSEQQGGPSAKVIWTFAIATAILSIWASTLTLYNDGISAEFARISIDAVFIYCVFLASVLCLLFAAIFGIATLLGVGGGFARLSYWIAAFFSLTSTLLPLPLGVGMTSLGQYSLSLNNLVLALVASALSASLLRTRAALLPLFTLAAMPATVIATEMHALLLENTRAGHEFPSVTSGGSIVVLSFDGIQNDVFDRVISEKPHLIKRLRNFRYFNNVISSSPATLASLSGVMVGNRNYKSEAETTDQLIAMSRTKGIATNLADNGYAVGSYGAFTYLMSPQFDMTNSLVRGDPSSELLYLFKVSLSRNLGPQLVASEKFAQIAQTLTSLVPIERPTYEASIAPQITLGHGPEWDHPLLRSWDDFNTYKQNLQLRDGAKAAHFLHFTFTHHPVDFDESCELRSGDDAWYKASQSYQGLVTESECAIRAMEGILERLDKIGAFAENLIIVMSDHGAPVQWNDPSAIEGRTIRNNADWGYGRYRPVLMTKLPSNRSTSMVRDSRPVMLDDLAISLCKWAALSDCSYYHGVNLLDPVATSAGRYYVNVVQGVGADFRYETHQTIELQRTTTPMEELDRYLSAEKSADPN